MKKDQRQQRLYVSEANSKQICSIHLRQGSLELEANEGKVGGGRRYQEHLSHHLLCLQGTPGPRLGRYLVYVCNYLMR